MLALVVVLATAPHWLAAETTAEAAKTAIATARAATDAAMAGGNLWLGTRDRLRRASAAERRGDAALALALANAATAEARMAINQTKLERARYLLTLHGKAGDSARVAQAYAALDAHDGDGALALAQSLASGR